jgi:hypothetical protein
LSTGTTERGKGCGGGRDKLSAFVKSAWTAFNWSSLLLLLLVLLLLVLAASRPSDSNSAMVNRQPFLSGWGERKEMRS